MKVGAVVVVAVAVVAAAVGLLGSPAPQALRTGEAALAPWLLLVGHDGASSRAVLVWETNTACGTPRVVFAGKNISSAVAKGSDCHAGKIEDLSFAAAPHGRVLIGRGSTPVDVHDAAAKCRAVCVAFPPTQVAENVKVRTIPSAMRHPSIAALIRSSGPESAAAVLFGEVGFTGATRPRIQCLVDYARDCGRELFLAVGEFDGQDKLLLGKR